MDPQGPLVSSNSRRRRFGSNISAEHRPVEPAPRLYRRLERSRGASGPAESAGQAGKRLGASRPSPRTGSSPDRSRGLVSEVPAVPGFPTGCTGDRGARNSRRGPRGSLGDLSVTDRPGLGRGPALCNNAAVPCPVVRRRRQGQCDLEAAFPGALTENPCWRRANERGICPADSVNPLPIGG